MNQDEIAEKSAEEEIAGDSGAQEETERDAGKTDNITSDSGVALYKNEIEILINDRISYLDKGRVKAYAARSKKDVGKANFFAMVCEDDLIPRSRVVHAYDGIVSASLVRLIGSGVVFWPPAGKEKYVFIFKNDLGAPLMTTIDGPGIGWKQSSVMDAIVKPMVNVLMDMRNAGVVHGSVRPTNMFDGGVKKVERVILGDCLSTPPSYTQPVLFEIVERAMADPIGRGIATSDDDLYAFGVSIVMILRTKDYLQGMTDDEIIRHKIGVGSYAALTGKDRFSGAILELMRGLLYDDPEQRWTLEDVHDWMDGQRLSPRQVSKKRKAARPVHFNDERYYRPVLLAMDLEKNKNEALQFVDSGTLEQWISRSLGDALLGNRVEKALTEARENGRGAGYADRLLGRVSIALDPGSPLRFKGLKMNPEGISHALVRDFVLKKDLSSYVDIINQKLETYWLDAQGEAYTDTASLVTRYDSCRAFLRQPNAGYGIERCLYFLNPDCPCLSDKLQNHYVLTPEDMLDAFEKIIPSHDRSVLLLDRHSIAFLSVKDRKNIDSYFSDLNSSDYHKRILANVKVLATIQKRSQMGLFPDLTAWVADILEPVYEQYHDRSLRTKVRNKINKLKNSGSLSKIAGILDNSEMLQADFSDFKKAMQEYHDLREDYKNLKQKLETPETLGRETGHEVAAIVSGVLAGILMLGFTFMFLGQKGIF